MHLDNCTAKETIQEKGQLQNGVIGNRKRAKRELSKQKMNTYKDLTKQLVSGSSDEKIKLIRAQGGCPGTIRRRRTWQAAKSYGEPQAGIDP
jgi:hypothetical protein